MFDVEREFFGTQRSQGIFQCGDIKRRFAAELLVKHPRICPGLADDAADAPAGKAMGDELRRGGAQDLLAVLFRGTARTALGRYLTLARCSVGRGIPISHTCTLER